MRRHNSMVILLSRVRFLRAILFMVAILVWTPLNAQTINSDVVVYGGTSAGVIAAVQAARMKKSVILIEPGNHVGGMTASGLGLADTGQVWTISGLSREFFRRIYRYYESPSAWKYASREEYMNWLPPHWRGDPKPGETSDSMFVFEPHVAEHVYNEMLFQAGVKVVTAQRLDLKRGVEKAGPAIRRITMESGRIFVAKVFIDATYEGDLMAGAGVKYTVGREPNSQYGETINGVLPSGALVFKHVDPYVVKGDPTSGLLPRVDRMPPGKPGEGDHRNQAYNFRMTLTDVPGNRVPFTKPSDYDPKQYELLARWIATMKNVRPGKSRVRAVSLRGDEKELGISFDLMPNRKTDSNNGSEFGSDYYGRSYDWAEANYVHREKIWQEHKTYEQGLLWFLANDERCPEPVRREMQKWGLAKDEYTDNGNWPFQLYVREARRMVSDYVMTEHDARQETAAADSISLASYSMDSHGVSLFINEQGQLCREKGFFIVPGKIFPISYRAIRPRANECSNLLVPVCVSSSHAAYGPIRMEPVFMMLGQAAGTGAVLAIDGETAVQDVPYEELRLRLITDHLMLDAPKMK